MRVPFQIENWKERRDHAVLSFIEHKKKLAEKLEEKKMFVEKLKLKKELELDREKDRLDIYLEERKKKDMKKIQNLVEKKFLCNVYDDNCIGKKSVQKFISYYRFFSDEDKRKIEDRFSYLFKEGEFRVTFVYLLYIIPFNFYSEKMKEKMRATKYKMPVFVW